MAAIIAYFSRRGENYVSGKLKELSVGNTEVAAGMLQQLTGADLFQLEPVHEYPKSYNAASTKPRRTSGGTPGRS